MKQRQLGKDGPFLTEIGMGTWAIGGPWRFGWGPQNDKASLETIRKAIDSGVNWIDTAAVYGLGHSEEMVAKAVDGRRGEVFIATKCGMVWDSNKKVSMNIQPESILREAEASLKRLKTDYIDLYQIHWPDGKTPVDAAWEAMAKLKEQGKVRYIGVSNFDVSQLEKCHSVHPVNSLQPPFSLLKRSVELEILPWCREHGVGVIAYSPMQAGLLTGGFDKSRLASGDWRLGDPLFQEPRLSKNLQFVEGLRPIAEKYGKSLAHLAIAWVLMNRAVTAAIVGSRKPEQVEKNIGGAGWKIEPADMEKIEEIAQRVLG